ncbi:MAG TPA: glycerate kinase [Saprospiraceae bacterium]|nr:glycerate kinase [Saprospiraceae bacterium]
MNILIACDKFKGSLSALEASDAIKKGVNKILPNSNVTILPLADGGEGSLEVIEKKLNFKRILCSSKDPLLRSVNSWYGLQGKTAYIEMAISFGLQLLKENEKNALLSSSIGTGELILDALEKGARKIYLFVGGSATSDAGIGMAYALGYRFINKDNQELTPNGESLRHITSIGGKPHKDINRTDFYLISDVNNPLFGSKGAAKMFAKQKGASSDDIKTLEKGFKNFNEIVKTTYNIDINAKEGAGAAGGLGAGAMVFLKAKKKNGINSIMDILNFDNYVDKSDIVISGEGKFDNQTLNGKVINGVIEKCIKNNKPLGIVCGIMELSIKETKKLPIKAIEPIVDKQTSKEAAMNNAYELLTQRSATLIEKMIAD